MFSNSYSTLEEAWGVDTSSKKTRSRSSSKSAKMRDPICELYELGASPSRAYTEMDVMNAIGTPSRQVASGAAPLPPSMMQSREPELDEPIEVVQNQARPPTTRAPKEVEPAPVDDDDDMSEFLGYIDKQVTKERKEAANAVLPNADIGLYMISGVILIFMMEQFIKIGMAMRGY